MAKLPGSIFISMSMSYLPFHHKYRPQTFADLVGQEAIATTLTNALRSQKIAPAYLFTGPRGTGKTSSARILAKSLNCMASDVPTAQPCGECLTCKSITLGNALDVVEIDAASNTGVDNIRELIDRSQYAPVQCRYKVYLIDECHMLSTAAFNSLLKTLEEPPLHVVFILATTDPQRVLPTIISRCQKFDFRRIPLADMVKHLTYIAQLEQMQITAGAVQLVAQIAQGGLRDAESLLDQLSLMSSEVTVDRVWELVGAVPEKDLLAMSQAIHQQNIEKLFDHCGQLLERGKEPLMILQNLAGFYRDLSIAKAIPSRPDLTNLTAEIWSAVCELAASMELATILAGQQHLKDSESQLKGNTQPRLWLEITVLGLLSPVRAKVTTELPPFLLPIVPSNLPPTAGVGEPIDLPESARQQTKESLPIAVVPVPELIPAEPEMIIDLEDTWQQVLGQLLPSGKGLFAPHGQLLSVESDVATVGMKSSTFMKIAEGQKQHLQKALTALLAKPITVVLKLGDADLANKNKAAHHQPAQNEVVPSVAPPTATSIPADHIATSSVSSGAQSLMPASSSLATAEILDAPDEHLELDEVEIQASLPAISTSSNVVQEQSADFRSPPPEASISLANGLGNRHNDNLPEAPMSRQPENTSENMGDVVMASFTDLDLDAAAARLAEQFGGEIVEEYVTIWNL